MRIFVKICGLSTPRAVSEALHAGADAIGFVFAESPRQVTPKRAAQLCRDVSPAIIRVAVMRNPTQDEWQRVADEFAPDWLQTEAGDFARLDLADGISRLPVFRDTPDLDLAAFNREELLLFEAGVSGQGVQADWQRAAQLVAGMGAGRQLVLAGGLTPENVGAAIATVRPYGVDVSSGVESRRGVKDPDRIAAFMAAVRQAESNNAKR
ncbi:MAG: phosphoribosylanthranilate isomerase [Gammaproteobacteria bacterium]